MTTQDYKSTYEPYAAALALQQGIPSELFRNLIQSESSWNPRAEGAILPGGQRAIGIAQFIPETAARYGIKDRTDPYQSMQGAAKYMKDLYAKYGNWPEAVAAYKGFSDIKKGATSDLVKKVTPADTQKEYEAAEAAKKEPASDSAANVNPDPIWKWGAQDWRNFFARSALGLVLFLVGVLLIVWSIYAVIMRGKGSTVVKLAGAVAGKMKG